MAQVDIDDILGKVKPESRRKKNRCKICRKVLSMYNMNKFCFSHMFEGLSKTNGKVVNTRFSPRRK